MMMMGMMGMMMGRWAGARTRRIMVSMMMMGMMWMMGWGRLRAWSRTVAVGPILIAGRYAVGAAPEIGSSTPAHILRIVRGWFRFVAATRVGM
jgi:hypothetical protein